MVYYCFNEKLGQSIWENFAIYLENKIDQKIKDGPNYDEDSFMDSAGYRSMETFRFYLQNAANGVNVKDQAIKGQNLPNNKQAVVEQDDSGQDDSDQEDGQRLAGEEPAVQVEVKKIKGTRKTKKVEKPKVVKQEVDPKYLKRRHLGKDDSDGEQQSKEDRNHVDGPKDKLIDVKKPKGQRKGKKTGKVLFGNIFRERKLESNERRVPLSRWC